MTARDKKREEVEEALQFLAAIFNPRQAPKQACDCQLTFQEPEGHFDYHLAIRDGICRVVPGVAPKPLWWLVTDIDTWSEVAGGYLSGMAAVRSGRLSFKRGMLRFLWRFGKMFGGRTHVTHRATATVDLKSPDTIEKVLILSCSHRAERGATQLLVDRLQKGMERAGADVAVMFPSKMDIHPCCGRFLCWRSGDGTCVHRDDDMSTFFEVFRECDLLVWATPVYFYHGTAWMKILMERLFALDDHSIVLKDGLETHPVRIERWPHQALLATSGFADRDVFIPLKTSLRCMLARKGRRPMAELVRPAAMTFLIDKPRFKTKDEVLLAVEEAGEEMVSLKRVSKATKKSVEQPLMPFPMQLSAGNFALDRTLERGDFVFEKKR